MVLQEILPGTSLDFQSLKQTSAIGGISDIRSIRFTRMYMNGFTEETVLRFATLDLVRSDWRRYT